MSTQSTTKPNIGFDSLRETTKEKTIESKQLRDQKRQNEYRKNSRSQNKVTQDVAHKLGLERVSAIIGDEGGIDPEDKENKEVLKQFENDDDNLRMKTRHSNRSTDKTYDNKVEKKIDNGETLTKKEEAKERHIVQNIQAHQDKLTPEIYNKFEDHFKKEKTQSGHTTWDARKDTKKMTEARHGGKKKVK